MKSLLVASAFIAIIFPSLASRSDICEPNHPQCQPAPTVTPTPTPTPTPPPAGVDLQALVNAAGPGATIAYSGSWSGALLIDKPLTIHGGRINGSVRITANNVTLREMTVLGPQSASYVSSQNAIYAEGVSGVVLDRVEAGNVGNAAVRLHFVTGFQILMPNIYDAVYAGIITTSSTDGLIEGGTVSRIGVTGSEANSGNAYGITLTRFGQVDPKAARITVRGVTVTDVPTWHGLDTHGGLFIVFENNTIRGTYRGIMLTGYGGQDNIARGNLIEQSSRPEAGRGVLVSDNQRYQIKGNTIIGPLPTGIRVLAGSCGAISGNTITNVGTLIYDLGSQCSMNSG